MVRSNALSRRNRSHVRTTLRLEQLERRCLFARTLLEPGWTLCGEMLVDTGGPPPAAAEGPSACVTNYGPGSIWVELALDRASLQPARGRQFHIEVKGVAGGRGDATWLGDADVLTLSATGSIDPLTISGTARLSSGDDIGAVRAARAAIAAGDAVAAVTVGQLEWLTAADAGIVQVTGDAGPIEVDGRLESLSVGGDASAVRAGDVGPVAVSGDLSGLFVRSPLTTTVTVLGSAGQITADAILAAIHVGGDVDQLIANDSIQAEITVGGTLRELTAGGSVNGTVRAGAVERVDAEGNIALTMVASGPVGVVSTSNGQLSGTIQASALGTLSAYDRIDATLQVRGSVDQIISQSALIDIKGEIQGDLGRVATGAAANMALDVQGRIGTLRVTTDLNGRLTAASVQNIIVGRDAVGELEVTANVGDVNVGGDFSSSFRAQSLGSLRVGGDLSGSVHTSAGVQALTVADTLSGTVQVDGNLGTLRVGADLSGSVAVRGAVNAVSIGADLSGTIRVGGDLAAMTVAADMTGTLQADRLSELIVGRRLAGVLDVTNSLNTLVVGWDLRSSAPATGVLETASITVGRDLGSLTVHGGDEEASLISRARVRVGGSVNRFDVNAPFVGHVVVGGDLGSFRVGRTPNDQSDVTVAVNSDLRNLVSRGVLILDLDVGGDVLAIQSEGDARATLTVGGSVGRVESLAGSLAVQADVTGRLESIRSAADAALSGTVAAGLGSVEVGKRFGGNLTGNLTVEGPVGSIIAWDDLVGQRSPQPIDQLEPAATSGLRDLLVNGQLPRPPRPQRPARGRHGNVSMQLTARGPIGYFLAAGNLAATVRGEGLEWLYAGGDLTAELRLTSDQPVWVDAWGDAVVDLSTGGPADVTAFGNLELRAAQTGGLLDAGSWNSLRLVAQKAVDIQAWSWNQAAVMVLDAVNLAATFFASANLAVSAEGEIEAVAAGALDVQADIPDAETATLFSVGPLNVNLTAPNGTVYLYTWSDATWRADGRRVRATSWGQATGSINAAETAEVYVLGAGELDVAAGHTLIYEAAEHVGSLRSGGSLSFEIFGTASGTFQAAGPLTGYVHGTLEGTVDNTSGPTSLTTSGPLAASVRSAGPVALDVGSVVAPVETDDSLRAVVHGDLAAPLQVGAGSELEVWGNAAGDWQISGPFRAQVHGDMLATVRSTGDVRAVIAGSWNGAVLAAAVGPHPDGQVTEPTPSVFLYVYGTADGLIQADGDASVTALGGLEANVSSVRGSVDVASGAALSGTFDSRESLTLFSVGPAQFEAHASGPVSIHSYQNATGQVRSGADLAVSAGDAVDLQATVDGVVSVRALGPVAVSIEASDVVLASAGSLSGSLDATGRVAASARGPISLNVDATEAVDVRSWENVTLTARTDGPVDVIAAGTVTHDLEAATILVDAAGGVTGRATAQQSVRVYTHDSVEGDYSAGRTLELTAGGTARGTFVADDRLVVHAAGGLYGTLRSHGPLTITAADGPVQAEAASSANLSVVAAEGIRGRFAANMASLRATGPITADVESADTLTITSLSDLNGNWRSGGDAQLIAGAELRGKLASEGDATLIAGDDLSVQANVQGALRLYAVESISGSFTSGASLTATALGDIRGVLHAGDGLWVRAGGNFDGNAAATGPTDIRVTGAFTGQSVSGGPQVLIAREAVHGTVASSGNAAVISDGDIQLRLAANGNTHVAAGASVQGSFDVGGIFELAAVGELELEVRASDADLWTAAGGQVKVTAAGPVRATSLGAQFSLNVPDASTVDVFSAGTATIAGRSRGSVKAVSLSSLDVDWDAGADVSLRSGGNLAGRIGADGSADLLVLGDAVADLDTAGSLKVTSLGNLVGEWVAGGSVEVFTWGGLDNLLVRAADTVTLTAIKGGTGEISARGDVTALFLYPGALVVTSPGNVRLTALTDGAFTVRSSSLADLTFLGSGTVQVRDAGSLIVQAGGTLDVDASVAGSVDVRSGGPLGARLAGDLVRAESWAKASVEVPDAGIVERIWSVADLSVAAAAQRIELVRSYGAVDANLHAVGCASAEANFELAADQMPCGTIGAVLARGSLGGTLVADQVIGQVRAGGLLYADLFAPVIGTVVSFDQQLAQEDPPARPRVVDEALLAWRDALLQEAREIEDRRAVFQRAVSAFLDRVRSWRDTLQQQLTAARAEDRASVFLQQRTARKRIAAQRAAAEEDRRRERVLREEALSQLLAEMSAIKEGVDRELSRRRAGKDAAIAEAKQMIAREQVAAEGERLEHADAWQETLSERDDESRNRPAAWVEAVEQTKEQLLSELQRIAAVAAVLPGAPGMIGGAVHFAIAVVHSDLEGAAVDVIARFAREFLPARTGYAVAQTMGAISAIEEWAEAATEAPGGDNTRPGPGVPSEPACFVAGTPIVVVRQESNHRTSEARRRWDELAADVLLAASALVARRLLDRRWVEDSPTAGIGQGSDCAG